MHEVQKLYNGDEILLERYDHSIPQEAGIRVYPKL